MYTHTHVGTHARTPTHTTAVRYTPQQCVCLHNFSVHWPVYIQSFHLIHSWPGRESHWSHLNHFLFFPTSHHHRFKGHCLQVSVFVLWLCVSARPWLLYQTGDSGLQLLSLRSTAHYLRGCQPFPMFAQRLSLLRHRKRWHGPQGLCVQVPPPVMAACHSHRTFFHLVFTLLKNLCTFNYNFWEILLHLDNN